MPPRTATPPQTEQTQSPAPEAPALPEGAMIVTPEDLEQLTQNITDRVRAELSSDQAAAAPAAPARAKGPTKAQREAAADRESKIRELMGVRAHLEDCPVGEGRAGRVEAYESRKPARPQDGEPAKDVTVLRCVECGGSKVLDGTPDHHDL